MITVEEEEIQSFFGIDTYAEILFDLNILLNSVNRFLNSWIHGHYQSKLVLFWEETSLYKSYSSISADGTIFGAIALIVNTNKNNKIKEPERETLKKHYFIIPLSSHALSHKITPFPASQTSYQQIKYTTTKSPFILYPNHATFIQSKGVFERVASNWLSSLVSNGPSTIVSKTPVSGWELEKQRWRQFFDASLFVSE